MFSLKGDDGQQCQLHLRLTFVLTRKEGGRKSLLWQDCVSLFFACQLCCLVGWLVDTQFCCLLEPTTGGWWWWWDWNPIFLILQFSATAGVGPFDIRLLSMTSDQVVAAVSIIPTLLARPSTHFAIHFRFEQITKQGQCFPCYVLSLDLKVSMTK